MDTKSMGESKGSRWSSHRGILCRRFEGELDDQWLSGLAASHRSRYSRSQGSTYNLL
jgi:hypothetical protein